MPVLDMNVFDMLQSYSEEWAADCKRHWGRVLTGAKSHWCPDWDYMPIDDTCHEIDVCTCNPDDYS